jgi:hypothetical protein
MKRLPPLSLLVVSVSFSIAASPGARAAKKERPLVTQEEKLAARAITPERIRSHIRFLASDLLEGRGPATRGDRLAEAYVQAQMEAMHIQPGAPAAAGSRRCR